MVTSSTSAIHGAPRNQAYASTKGAVLAMIRGLAVEYARYGIRANSILPGWIATDMTAGPAVQRQVQREGHRPGAHAPLGRARRTSPASRSTWPRTRSKFHTGDSFVIDGGYTIF